jgi:hypothetical protein
MMIPKHGINTLLSTHERYDLEKFARRRTGNESKSQIVGEVNA